jgi:hypothetical protein
MLNGDTGHQNHRSRLVDLVNQNQGASHIRFFGELTGRAGSGTTTLRGRHIRQVARHVGRARSRVVANNSRSHLTKRSAYLI